MRGFYTLVSFMVTWLAHTVVCGQDMQGHVLDVNTSKPLQDVAIYNIYTDERVVTDREGAFVIKVDQGQLVEFRKDGFKILRIRIPAGKRPSYFKVMMQVAGTDVIDYVHAKGAAPDYKTDSLRYYNLYKESLEFPRLTGVEVIQHPFSAMSKKNRQIWAFQDDYKLHQQQKYIDYTFNPKLVSKITGFEGDSLKVYMEIFRPTYALLRNMSEYAYFNYIKRTADAYRQRGPRVRQSNARTPQ